MARHRLRATVAFAILFVAYQAPEGVGSRLLGSFAVQAVLMLAFLPIAYAVGRWLGRGFDAFALFRHPGWARNSSPASRSVRKSSMPMGMRRAMNARRLP